MWPFSCTENNHILKKTFKLKIILGMGAVGPVIPWLSETVNQHKHRCVCGEGEGGEEQRYVNLNCGDCICPSNQQILKVTYTASYVISLTKIVFKNLLHS